MSASTCSAFRGGPSPRSCSSPARSASWMWAGMRSSGGQATFSLRFSGTVQSVSPPTPTSLSTSTKTRTDSGLVPREEAHDGAGPPEREVERAARADGGPQRVLLAEPRGEDRVGGVVAAARAAAQLYAPHLMTGVDTPPHRAVLGHEGGPPAPAPIARDGHAADTGVRGQEGQRRRRRRTGATAPVGAVGEAEV